MVTRHGRSKTFLLDSDAIPWSPHHPGGRPGHRLRGRVHGGRAARRAAGRVRDRRPPADRRPVPGRGGLGPDPGPRCGPSRRRSCSAWTESPAASGTGSRSPWRRKPAGPGVAGGGLGYQGLTNSVAVKFDLVDNAGEGGHSVGVFTGGADPTMPAVRLDGTPIHLHAQHPIRADLAYDGRPAP